MKKNKVIFWVTTTLVAVMMIFSAYSYLTNDQIKGAFIHLGFPSYFRVELAVAKILGAIVLLLPMIPGKLKEWAYFGFGLTFISAFVAHIANGDPTSVVVMPIIFLAVLAVSYLYYGKTRQLQKA